MIFLHDDIFALCYFCNDHHLPLFNDGPFMEKWGLPTSNLCCHCILQGVAMAPCIIIIVIIVIVIVIVAAYYKGPPWPPVSSSLLLSLSSSLHTIKGRHGPQYVLLPVLEKIYTAYSSHEVVETCINFHLISLFFCMPCIWITLHCMVGEGSGLQWLALAPVAHWVNSLTSALYTFA